MERQIRHLTAAGWAFFVGAGVASGRLASLAVTLAFALCAINGTTHELSNSPPSIALTNPASGSVFTWASIIRLKASASDADGIVTQVSFLDGTNILGILVEPPYQLFLTNVLAPYPVSDHDLVATATDDQGAMATSAVVRIVVL
jgi:hypothetical protein